MLRTNTGKDAKRGFFSLNFAIWPLNQVFVQRIRTAVLGQSISGVINTFYVKKIV